MRTILLAVTILILTSITFAGDRYVMASSIASDEATAVQNAMNSLDCDGTLRNVHVSVHKNGNFYNAQVSATCHTEDARMMNASAVVQQSSSLGTCRLEYSQWYPSESYKGEPEILLAKDVSEQAQNLYLEELLNRGKELLNCSVTASENPVGENRWFERLAMAYNMSATKRYVDFLNTNYDAEFFESKSTDPKHPVPLIEWLEKMEIASVGALREYKPYNPLIPFGPVAAGAR